MVSLASFKVLTIRHVNEEIDTSTLVFKGAQQDFALHNMSDQVSTELLNG